MTELNKWIIVKAGHDEDEHDIDIYIVGVYDSEAKAKEELETVVNSFDGCEISWSDNDTKVTITSSDDCDDWCRVYEIKKI
jgi:hypothetical protein